MHAGFSVDRENRIVRNVCLLGKRSRNGYDYKDAAIQEAGPKYSGRVVYIDHSQTPSKRSLLGKAGRIMASPRFESGRGLFGDIKASKGAAGDFLLDEAQEQIDNPDAKDVGMSHVVEGRMSKNGKLVESIEKVISVDVVFNPATMTQGFRESENDKLEQLKPLLSGKKPVLERLKAIYEAADEDFKIEEQELPEVAVLTLESVNDLREIAKDKPAIKAFIESYDGLQRKQWAREVITESKLPDSDKTIKALSRFDSKEAMTEQAVVLKEAIEAVKPEPGTKQGGRQPASTGLTVDSLIGAIKK